MMNIWYQCINYLFAFFRCFFKGFFRRVTGLCELQRICYADNIGAARAKGVERSISLSKSSVLKRIDTELTNLANADQLTHNWETVEKAVEATVVAKLINKSIHVDFIQPYRLCLVQIYSYRQLITKLEKLREITFDHENESHKLLLMTLWKQLNPNTEIDSLISEKWTDIGFQGKDPSTDFRGMGLLSLENLVFLATVYTDHARNILSHSFHPKHGYPFAAVGINITHLALNLINTGYLKTHLYNLESKVYEVEDFHKIYSYLFVSFDKLWVRSKPSSVMEFSHIRDKFEAAVIRKLQDNSAVFRWDPYLETI